MTMLIVMRLSEMRRVHPQQITRRCDRCGETCGVYPSGQRILAREPATQVLCSHCSDPATATGLAPGAVREMFESVDAPDTSDIPEADESWFKRAKLRWPS